MVGMRIALLLVLACLSGWAAAATPRKSQLHGAIAYHTASGSVGWATGHRTSREAKVEALRQCAHPRCEVVATVRGGCAALAKRAKAHAVQKGATQAEAEAKALRRCGEGCEIGAWVCTR